jgi:hypothetical protein
MVSFVRPPSRRNDHSTRFFFLYCGSAGRRWAAREGAWNEKDLSIGRRGDREFGFASISRGSRRRPLVWFDAPFFGAELSLVSSELSIFSSEPQLFECIGSSLFGAARFSDAKLPQLCRGPDTVHADDQRAKSGLRFERAPVQRKSHYGFQFAKLHALESAAHAG